MASCSTTPHDRCWEPLLAPWRGAFVVPAEHRDRAIAAAPPGTVLVIVEPDLTEQLPDGVADAPAGTARFLRTLLDRSDYSLRRRRGRRSSWPVGSSTSCAAETPPSPEHVPTWNGPSARTPTNSGTTNGPATPTSWRSTSAERLHAAGELATLRSARVRTVRGTGRRIPRTRRGRSRSHRREHGAVEARVQHDTAAQLATASTPISRPPKTRPERIDATSGPPDGDRTTRRRGWRRRGPTPTRRPPPLSKVTTARRTRCAGAPPSSWSSRLERVGIDSTTGDGAPTPSIDERDPGPTRARRRRAPTNEVRRFDTVAQPLVDWLDDQADHDATFREDVEAERQRWENSSTPRRTECETQGDLLDRHRDMVEQQIEAALGHVSAALRASSTPPPVVTARSSAGDRSVPSTRLTSGSGR